MRLGPTARAWLLSATAALAFACSGKDGSNGSSCSVTDNGDGTSTIRCSDGTSATVRDGQNGFAGTSCTVRDNLDGTKTISCSDGTSVIVVNGVSGGNVEVANFHRTDARGPRPPPARPATAGSSTATAATASRWRTAPPATCQATWTRTAARASTSG